MSVRAPACLVAAMLLFGSACGDGGKSPGDLGRDLGGRLDDAAAAPCDLLRPSEIADVLGGPVAQGEESAGACVFAVGGDQGEPGSGNLEVSIPAPSPTVEPDVWFDSLRTGGDVTVRGVGDAAFYEPESATLKALAGGTVLVLRASLIPEPDDLRDSLEELARAAVDRLET